LTNGIGMKFVLIPAGTFMMGSPGAEVGREDDEVQHKVTITRAFYLQTTPVTQGQWGRLMGDNPSRFKDGGDECPVEKICWDEAQRFIEKLKEIEGTDKYRFPTEAEWEYACRAGSTERFCFGDDEGKLGEYAWYGGNSEKKTHPVGQKKANAWGLYDMHGNVWEWCQDCYGDYPVDPVTNPTGSSSCEFRVSRGGSWFDSASNLRSAHRGWGWPDNRVNNLGFRLAWDL
jgi:formylglycine-generating enzyme required for sulfatase activity